MRKNKTDDFSYSFGKRAEKIYIFWWFISCLLVFIVIIFMAAGFFTQPIDVRDVQAKAIYIRAADCFTDGAYLTQTDGGFNSIDKCGFAKAAMELNKGLVYVRINDSNLKTLYESQMGSGDLKLDCDIASGIYSKAFPYCYLRKAPVYYYENGVRKDGFLEILAASNYYGERVSVIKMFKLPVDLESGNVK